MLRLHTSSRRPGVRRNESGFTMTELALSLGLLAVVIALMTPTYLALNGAAVHTQAQTTTDEALRPTLLEFSRQVGSASAVYCPSTATNYSYSIPNPSCSTGGFSILMYSGGSSGRCVQWRVLAPASGTGGVLQVRSWAPNTSSTVKFTTAAFGVLLMNGANQYPFSVSTANSDPVVGVDFFVSSSSSSPTVEMKTQVAAQGLGPPSYSSACSTLPSS